MNAKCKTKICMWFDRTRYIDSCAGHGGSTELNWPTPSRFSRPLGEVKGHPWWRKVRWTFGLLEQRRGSQNKDSHTMVTRSRKITRRSRPCSTVRPTYLITQFMKWPVLAHDTNRCHLIHVHKLDTPHTAMRGMEFPRHSSDNPRRAYSCFWIEWQWVWDPVKSLANYSWTSYHLGILLEGECFASTSHGLKSPLPRSSHDRRLLMRRNSKFGGNLQTRGG